MLLKGEMISTGAPTVRMRSLTVVLLVLAKECVFISECDPKDRL